MGVEKYKFSTMLKKGHIEYIDIAKGIAILLVLVGHAVDSDTLIKKVVYAFHMPLFFMLSGMVLREKPICIKNVVNKLNTLMVPFVIWGCIYAEFSFKNLAYILWGTRETLIIAGTLTSLWFLPVLFLASCLTELIIYAIGKRVLHKQSKLIVGVGISIVALLIGFIVPHEGNYGFLWGVDIACVAFAFILFGYVLRSLVEKLINFSIKVKVIMFILSCIVLMSSVVCNNISVGYVLMANGIYGSPFWFLLGALSGYIIVILLASTLTKFDIKKKGLLFIGQNTLGIFLVHKPIIEMGRVVMTRIGFNYNNFVVVIINSMVSLFLSAFIVLIINFFAPSLMGKNKVSQ